MILIAEQKNVGMRQVIVNDLEYLTCELSLESSSIEYQETKASCNILSKWGQRNSIYCIGPALSYFISYKPLNFEKENTRRFAVLQRRNKNKGSALQQKPSQES